MSGSPIQYATLLRRELSARNASYAALHQFPHVISYGEVPVVVYQPSPCGTKHGNFVAASYRALQRRPQWKRRFEKVHSQAGRAFPRMDCVSKELDSSMSSDALLMTIFCYPGVTKRRELSLMLGTETGDLPEFGFKPRIPLISGFVERTEIDMKLGTVLFEAKLTESDFQTQKAAIVEGYRDLKEVFNCRRLSRRGREYVSYQLLRNVLAAHALTGSFNRWKRMFLSDSAGAAVGLENRNTEGSLAQARLHESRIPVVDDSFHGWWKCKWHRSLNRRRSRKAGLPYTATFADC